MTTISREPEVVRGYRSRPANPRPTPSAPAPSQPPSPWRQRVPGPQLPGLVSGVLLASGVWLVLAPFVLSYGSTGSGFGARWNDVLVGLALTATAVARLTGAVRLGVASAVPLLLGLWLLMAPLVLAYGLRAGSTQATLNDMVVGLLVAAMATLGYVSGRMLVSTRI